MTDVILVPTVYKMFILIGEMEKKSGFFVIMNFLRVGVSALIQVKLNVMV